MKIKTNHILFSIIALTLLLVLIINYFPNNIARIILGLPLVLFFPGYTLIGALFPRKDSLTDIERLAFSFGFSLAIVPLIGLALNFLPWGIKLYPILIFLFVFIAIMSVIAWIRQLKLSDAEKQVIIVDFSFWGKRSTVNKVFSIVLVIAIFGIVGTLGYAITKPKTGEKFTEFYVLNSEGQAQNYPTNIRLRAVTPVIIGIVNHEQRETSYSIDVMIDGILDNTIGPIVLKSEEKFENTASFTPQKTGDNQKVEFFLYINGQSDASQELHLWVNVK